MLNKDKRKKLLLYVANKLSWLVLLGLGKSMRISVRNQKYWNQATGDDCGTICILWHGKMLLPIYVHRHQGLFAMVSEHGDGEVIAQAIIRVGFRPIRGSSTRGGQKAFREMLRELKKGETSVVLPDGPNGPRQKAKMGAVLLAQRSGAYLLPATFAAKNPIVINSWDRFTIWWPFSKGCMLYGEPIKIPRKLSAEELEEHRVFVEQRMLALEREADEIFQK